MLQDADALPQLIGDYKPVDQWQVRINTLFYRFRGDQVRSFYQTFASADYRLAHALAADYYARVVPREKARGKGVTPQRGSRDSSYTDTDTLATPLSPASPLMVMELGPGSGPAAGAISRSSIKRGAPYPRIRYLLVDWQQAVHCLLPIDQQISNAGVQHCLFIEDLEMAQETGGKIAVAGAEFHHHKGRRRG